MSPICSYSSPLCITSKSLWNCDGLTGEWDRCESHEMDDYYSPGLSPSLLHHLVHVQGSTAAKELAQIMVCQGADPNHKREDRYLTWPTDYPIQRGRPFTAPRWFMAICRIEPATEIVCLGVIFAQNTTNSNFFIQERLGRYCLAEAGPAARHL